MPAPPQEEGKAPRQLGQYPGSPFEDREGNLWFSIVGEGILRFDGKEYTSFTTENGLPGNIVRETMEGEGEHAGLWFGTDGGLVHFDGTDWTVMADYADPELKKAGPGFSGKGFHRDIWGMHRDRKGVLWLATLDGVFYLEDSKLKRLHLPALEPKHPFEFTSRMVYCIFEDVDGALWFGTDGAGAIRYDGKEQVVYTEADGLCGNHVSAILRDKRGDLWFGTSGGGISRLHEGEFSTHLRYETYQDHGVGWGRFLCLYEDLQGYVWFAVSGPGGGVYRFDGEDFRYFSTDDGLIEGGVYSIKEDRKGTLWFGSTAGVFTFDGERFHNFTRND